MRHGVESLLDQMKHIHFVGIGGSGMFPLVEILHDEGYTITGSDINEGHIVEKERAMGIPVHIGHAAENIAGADALIVTAALFDDNPEVTQARATGIPVIERADLLGWVTALTDHAVCVSGTHGKTTTTAMLSAILYGAKRDPSFVIGGYLPTAGRYGRRGHSEIIIVEACEYKDTFLKLFPYRAVILNIDSDHLDYFKSVENLQLSFRNFAELATKDIVANGDDAPTMIALAGTGKQVITYGEKESCDYVIGDIINYERAYYRFSLRKNNVFVGTFFLRVPGIHNVSNAAAAAVCALLEGMSAEEIQRGLDCFTGAGRRFEILRQTKSGITIADDYAHHPTEISATLTAAQGMGYSRVIAVFQPFTFTRTQLLLDEFAASLSKADVVIMTDIMGSREVDTGNVTTEDLARRIPGSVWFKRFEEVVEHTLAVVRPGDLVLTLGCGDIYKAADMMVKRCK